MPELPEVEVLCRGLGPLVVGKSLVGAGSSGKPLRSFSGHLDPQLFEGQRVESLQRKAKFLVFGLTRHWMLIHLGMSGTLRWLASTQNRQMQDPHVHFWLCFSDGSLLYHDPRRFGDLKFVPRQPKQKELDIGLLGQGSAGLEPFSAELSGQWLWSATRGVRQSIKPWLMRGDTVVGVGNIYASEALFRASIHPLRLAGSLSRQRAERLVALLRQVLQEAIDQGGSTLRDFRSAQGAPGYFVQSHRVYGRNGLPCLACGKPIRRIVQAQRATFYCPGCQH